MTVLHLVRHGETDWNAAGRIQGATDVPLNDRGRAQARRAGELLARRRVDAVVASPLVRAAETGAIVAERLGLPAPELVAALAERRYGVAEGLTAAEVEHRYPPGTSVPGREGRRALLDRVRPALVDLGRRHPGRVVVVATHGAVIRSIVTAVSGDDGSLVGVPIRNGSVHTFELTDDRLVLRTFDDPVDGLSEAEPSPALSRQNPLEGHRRE